MDSSSKQAREQSKLGEKWSAYEEHNASIPHTRTCSRRRRSNSQSKILATVNPEAVEALQCRQSQELLRREQRKTLEDVREKWMTGMDALKASVKKTLPPSVKNVFALDCEMVGVRLPGSTKNIHKAARVCVVDSTGLIVYDTHISQEHPISDYFTWITGIRRRNLRGAPSLEKVQRELHRIFSGNILVGHGLKGDLESLQIDHPIADQRDTQTFFMTNLPYGERKTNLKLMAYIHLNLEIQQGCHSPVDDAIVAMRLYLLYKDSMDAN